jgi:DNA-binding transcriptional ArsR family regulator
MEEKIVIDRDTLKAIVVENRLSILKLLLEKKYTQSEFAELLSISKPSVKEHLDILEKAKLITKEDTKRKWKYYSITFKGRFLVKPREVKVMFAFAFNIVAFLGVGAFILKEKVFVGATTLSQVSAEAVPMMARSLEASVADAAPNVVEIAQATTVADPGLSLTWFLVLGILGMTAAFMWGYLVNKKIIIITKGELK